MRPVVSERYGRFASRVEGFRGWRAPSAGLSGGWSSCRVGGSAVTPTQSGLIATGRIPTDRSSTAWPNGYWRTGQPSIIPESEAVKRGATLPGLSIGDIGLCASSRLASSRPEGHLWSAVLRVGLLADSTAFPQGSLWRERPPPLREGGRWPKACPPSPPLVPHQRAKKGSLPPPAPLSCGAATRRAGGGRARRSLASLCRCGRGISVLSRV